MKMHVEIVSGNVSERTGQNDRGPWKIRSQIGYLHFDTVKYPMEFELMLDNSQAGYTPGVYDFESPPFSSGKYGLEFKRGAKLRPVSASSKAAA